jgi:ppGpp synthetase/RelA/SpoT-type nucleotidyltranferase
VKPLTIEKYYEWAKTKLSQDFQLKENENRYASNLINIQNFLNDTQFFKDIDAKFKSWAEEYQKTKFSQLFMADSLSIVLDKKPYKSMIDKTFRYNVLWNKNFPDAPDKGWITLDNIYSNINDIIRTIIVCKFIDGPQFVTEKLKGYSDELGLVAYYYTQERDEGYYAYHNYVWFDVEILDTDWKSHKDKIRLEIQVTTQLQEILKELTHQYFEESRLDPASYDQKWKWEFSTGKFKAGYMSHTLHLLESIIVDLRDKKT